MQWRRYQERHGKWTDERARTALEELAEDQRRYAHAHRRDIVERCRSLGVSLASHDDALVERVEEAARDGIVFAEFPTTLVAAEASRRLNIATIMGAPNVVRGGSHSGNVSALELAQAGLLDILSSDYVPSSLLIARHSAWRRRRRARRTRRTGRCRARSPPSRRRPRGRRASTIAAPLRQDFRADLVRVASADGLPVPRATYRAGLRVG